MPQYIIQKNVCYSCSCENKEHARVCIVYTVSIETGHLLGRPLVFNHPKFLALTFNRTLSFTSHLASIKRKFFPRLKTLRCIASSAWDPSKNSLSLLHKAFIRPYLRMLLLGGSPCPVRPTSCCIYLQVQIQSQTVGCPITSGK